jgi:hypothetical protein
MPGIEMRHQHKGQAGVGWAGMKESLKGFQPTGRSTHANDGKGRWADHLIVSQGSGLIWRLLTYCFSQGIPFFVSDASGWDPTPKP